ncbi:hypothetical protein Thi970DRAFT_00399 [Thiorhodovibrio frisius]|uniref:Uncharacterized protein n=1 Tax=Thiorhodovibrio frisius TaxID=631362 RepID=H8YWE0_9GAMM|nr:hypothetical protein Thi970DRAFT_00399 [Thiorhodovibrio frisius]WPL20118.1 hypothetical protein Thiofri_00174 [Thiorhodovibrio frisius]
MDQQDASALAQGNRAQRAAQRAGQLARNLRRAR